MRQGKYSRRDVLKASCGLAAAAFVQPLKAAAPPPTPVTAALVEAARKEGNVSFYTALELSTSERLAKASKRNIPASRCAWSGRERSGTFNA
jgi:iron(III) transport system substrate-binding protein